jgi:hypothetical protein
MADPFTTTLVLMYFITPPAKIPTGEIKEIQEAKAAWTLQSTSHIETPNSTACVMYAQKLMAAVNPVNTLTLRAYCLCPNGDGDKKCYAPPPIGPLANAARVSTTPAIQAIGPKTSLPEPPPLKGPATE